MLRLPARFVATIIAFAPLFVHRSWRHAQVLLIGAILAPGQRTVASLLRIGGLRRERHFVNYHRVLSRALPFLTALAPSERFCREQDRRHKTLIDWGRQLALQARRWLPERDLILVTDSSFAALLFLDAMRRAGITTVTRLRLDAALYEPAPERQPGTIGRPRRKGARLPTLSEILSGESTSWQRVHVPGWYGASERLIEITSATAVWRHGGLPVVPIRWVLIRDPQDRFAPQALLCTDPTRDPAQIVSWFVRRWRVEVTERHERTWVSKRNGNGPTRPSPARPPACWRCSRS